MTQEQIQSLSSVTLQAALIIAVIVLWIELKAERKKRDDMFEKVATTLNTLAASQTQLAAQVTEQQRMVINLLKGDERSPVLPSTKPPGPAT